MVNLQSILNLRPYVKTFKAVQQQPVLVRLLWIFFFMQCVIMMLQPILALYVGDMQGTMEGADHCIRLPLLSIGGLAGSLTTNLWVRLGERRGYFKTISYCMMGSGVVLLLQSLPRGNMVVWCVTSTNRFMYCRD